MKLIVNISMILAVSIFIWWNISSANQEVEEARRDIEESEKAEEVKEFKLNYNRNVTEKDDAVSCIHEGKIALLVGDPIYIDKHTFTALSVDESEGIRRRSNKSDIVIRSMDPFKKSDLEPTNGIVPFVNIYPSTGNFGILIDRWSEDYFFRDIEHFDLANSEDWFKYNKTQSLILIDDHFVGKLDFRFSKGKDVSHLKESMDKYKLLKCMYSSIKRKAVYSFRGDHKVKAYHYWHSDMIVSMFENEVVIISMQREINHIERYLTYYFSKSILCNPLDISLIIE